MWINQSDPEALLNILPIPEEVKKKSTNKTTPTKKATPLSVWTPSRTKSSAQVSANQSDPEALMRLQGRAARERQARRQARREENKYKSRTITDFGTESRDAFASAYDKAKSKTTITSDLTEDERKKRIKEIDSELKTLNFQLNGYGRAKAYGTSKAMEENKQKVIDRIAELSKERKTLERTGTFTASELKQFEIDDAKAKKNALPAYNPTARVDPSGVEAYKQNIKAHSDADKEIEELKWQKKLYDDIPKFGDVVNDDTFTGQWRANYRNSELSREADRAFNEYLNNPTEENLQIAYAYDAFAKEYAKNNAKALDDEDAVATWLTRDLAGYLPQLRDQAPAELLGGVIGGALFGKTGRAIGSGLGSYAVMHDVTRGSVYRTLLAEGVDHETALQAANDEALVSALIEGGGTVLSWLFGGGNMAWKAVGTAAKTSVAKGSTNTVVKWLASAAGKATSREAAKVAKAVTRPLWNKALRVSGRVVGGGMSEYAEEFTQGAVNVANREQAYATVDKEIGQYGAGNIDLHNRPAYKNEDGSISTVDSVLYQIDDKFVLLPTIARDENGKAIRLKTDEEILSHFRDTGEFLGEFDTQEEANAYATKLHTAQAYRCGDKIVNVDDNLWSGGAKVVKSALSGDNPKLFSELHEQGKTGFKIGLMMGGSQTTGNTIIANYSNAKTVELREGMVDAIVNDDESLTALIEEGKASGEGTVSEKIATEIETARAEGKEVTRNQVKQLIESNEVYIKAEKKTAPKTTEQTTNTATRRLDNRKQNNEPITVDDVRVATGFGKSGAELVLDYASVEGISFSEVENEVKASYFTGFTEPEMDVSKVEHTFDNNEQRQAFLAGQIDRKMQNVMRDAKANNAKIYDGTFTENEHTKNFTNAEKRLISTVARSFGMDIATVDKILAETNVNGRKVMREANASHDGGLMQISNNRDANKAIFRLVLHEGGHRMAELAPKEFGALMNELYAYSSRANDEAGRSQTSGFDNVKSDYAGLDMKTFDYFEEFAVQEIENVFGSAHSFNRWYSQISTNKDARTAWQKIVDYVFSVIDDIKRALSQAKMSKAERAEANAQLDRIKELYANAYKAAEQAVAEKRQTAEKNSANSLENNTNEEYNKNINHSLKSNTSDEYSTEGTRWAVDNGLLTAKEQAVFWRTIADLTKRGYYVPKSKSGQYIIDVGQKLVFTNADFRTTEISSVIEFVNDGYQDNIDEFKEWIIDEERDTAQHGETFEIIEIEQGEGYVSEHFPSDYRTNERKNGRRKGTDSPETNQRSQKDVSDTTNYSLKGNWHTDLSRSDLMELMDEIRYDIRSSKNAITDEANWLFTDIGGKSVFAIYSTDNYKDPTLLYESKGKKAEQEHNILLNLLEETKNGESVDGKSAYVNWVSGGGWMQKVNGIENSIGGMHTRNGGTGNVAVLQGKSSTYGSQAFRNVIKNLIEVSSRGRRIPGGSDGGLNGGNDLSLKGTLSDSEIRNAITNKKLYKYVDKGIITTEKYNELVETYGAIPNGERPHREVQVPKKTAKDKKVSQTARTILEAKATPDEAVPTIEKMVEDGIFSYDVYTDKQAIEDADSYIKEYGWDESLDDWFDAVNKGEVSKQITAMGWALYNNAANIAATTTSETERSTAIKTSLKILDAMVRHQRSAAQALQATRILKSLSPETQLYGVQKSVQALQNELSDRYGDKAPALQIDEDLAEKFINAQTSEDRAEIEKEIYQDIGRQMPSRFIDKWNAWRYLSMLGNVRTHNRNIVGNAGFAPVVIAKDLTATAIESIVNRVSNKKIVRGKSLITGNKADRTLLKAAWGDYGNVADMISNGGKYNDSAMANKHIEEGRQIFKFKPLEWARKKNSELLEKEDMWFARPHYAYALAQYCKANNITAEQIKKGKAIAPAREYAIKEAQKATYRDTNAFSQMVSEWGRSANNSSIAKKAVSTVVEGILPFRKTPANILVRGVEYSPFGLLKGLSYDLYKVSKGEMSANDAIDNISAGLTGTGLLALGVFLAAQGLIRGHGEDDKEEKEFKELMGHQSYALELPNGQSTTLDWLAPEALPFFVGVNIWEATQGSGEEANLSIILQAVSRISEPMLEMSCLQSLNDLFEGIGYASSNDTSGLVSVISSAVTSYLTQGIPTLFGQAERTGEEYRMTTHTEKNGFLTDDIQYVLGKASAKIPLWEYNQIPYIDAWGRKEASGTALKRGFNNFLNPAYTSTVESSRTEKELLRLYESTGEAKVFPQRADKYFTVDGKRKDLTADEYVRYATLKGNNSLKVVDELMQSNAYKSLEDGEKVKAIAEAYDYANQKAKEAISNYKPDTWVNKADEFDSAGDYLSFRANVKAIKEENGDKISKQEVVDVILNSAPSDSDTWNMYLSMYNSSGDMYAYNKGIDGETYMNYLDALDRYDKPSKNGNYGTYTQEEARNAVNSIKGLSRQEKAILWQSVNTNWKRNPFG